MREHLSYIFVRYNYPTAPMTALLNAYDILEKHEEFLPFVEKFHNPATRPERADIETTLDRISADTGVHPYTSKFLYYLCLSKKLPEKYAAAGIPEELMWDMLNDFRYKLMECLEVYGIPGFFSNTWFYKFFTLEMFKLGRLEYELSYLPDTNLPEGGIKIAGRTLKHKDETISIHIPSSGEKFDREARFASYKMAYEFFNNVLGKKIDIFRCGSWLLYPPNKQILPAHSNIVSFMDDFYIYGSGDYSDPQHDLWRIFGADANKPYSELPRDTSLKRAYADWLEAGNKVGGGNGVFIWDNVNNTVITE